MVDPLVIITLFVTSLVLASAGARGFLSLVLHLMSRSNPVRVPVPVNVNDHGVA